MTISTTVLGRGLTVSRLGLGCMGMSEFYGASDEQESAATLRRALDLGVTLLDTAAMYGGGANERLVGRVIADRRDDVVLATKFGIERGADPADRRIDGSPDNVRRSCDASLQRLGVEHIDLYYQHRIDPAVPIEDTVGTLAGLATAGKGSATSACPRPAPTRCAGRRTSTRLPPCRRSSDEVLARLEEAAPVGAAAGDRYPDMAAVRGQSATVA